MTCVRLPTADEVRIWNFSQPILAAGAPAAVSKAMPNSHSPPNNELTASGSAPRTLRRRQLYRLKPASKIAAAMGGQIAGV